MRWQRFLGPAALAVALGPVGCAGDKAVARANVAASQADLVQAVARAGGADTDARAQKPEAAVAAAPVPLLDRSPERPAGVASGKPAVAIRATVNEQAILDEEVWSRCFQEVVRLEVLGLPEPELAKRRYEAFNAALNSLIERELVLQEMEQRFKVNAAAGKQVMAKLKEYAAKEFDKKIARMKAETGVKNDDDLKKEFDKQRISLEGMRRQFEREFIYGEYLRNTLLPRIEVTHPQMRDYYEKHPEEFKVDDGVRWQDLFVAYPGRHGQTRDDARRAAESLAARLRQGADFAALVKEYDDGDSSLRNGDGVGRKRGEISPAELEPVLFRMQAGEVGPVTEVGRGFHVLRLVQRDFAGTRPFDETVQKQIRDRLRDQRLQLEAKRYIRELKAKAVIEYRRAAD